MKKVLACVLAVTLSFAMMIPGAMASTKLTVSWWGSQTRADVTQAALDLYTQSNPDTTFDGQFSAWADYWNKIATASAGHTLPDLVQMDYKFLAQYARNGLFVDLQPYVDNGVLDTSSVDKSILESGMVDGKLYALCVGINAPALLYNKTLLEENGIEIKDNMSMAEFLDKCREVYEKTGYKTNVCYNNGTTWAEFQLRARDIVLFGEDSLGGSVEDLKEIFDIYEMGIKEGWHVDPSVFAEVAIGQPEQEPIVYGSSPEVMSWCAFYYSNNVTAVQNAAPEGVEIGITTWPSDAPEKANFLKPAMFLCVSTDSRSPDEAVKVLDFWTNSVECNTILAGERGVPIASVVSDAISATMSPLEQQVVSYINNVVAPACSVINPPAPAAAAEVYQLIYQLQEKVCYGVMTAEQAAQQLFEQGNAIMAVE